MKKSKLTLWLFVALVVAIQFIGGERAPQSPATNQHLFAVIDVPADMQQMLRSACFDCHSDSVRYPWYSYVAPVKWVINHHVEEGREHLNFSTFGQLDARQQANALHEAAEELDKGKMPVAGYASMHSDAKLSVVDKAKLIDWLNFVANTVQQGEVKRPESSKHANASNDGGETAVTQEEHHHNHELGDDSRHSDDEKAGN